MDGCWLYSQVTLALGLGLLLEGTLSKIQILLGREFILDPVNVEYYEWEIFNIIRTFHTLDEPS